MTSLMTWKLWIVFQLRLFNLQKTSYTEAFKVSGLSGIFRVFPGRYLFLEPNPGDPLNHEAAEVPNGRDTVTKGP